MWNVRWLRGALRAMVWTAAALGSGHAAAKWPEKPVTLVVPYAPGGGTDIVSRLVAQKLSERWGQSVIVENRPGANGVIGSSHVQKAAPDGYTLLMVVGSHAINPVLMKSIPYDTVRGFTPITRLARPCLASRLTTRSACPSVRTKGTMISTLVRPISSRTFLSASHSMRKHSAKSSAM